MPMELKIQNSKLKNQIVECVPNFSEGRNQNVINQIVAAIGSTPDVKVLNVDPGEATNRTVVTFVGSPEGVTEAAFRGVEAAARLIDMRFHHGTHPRSGACDVLPLIPISGITLEECAHLAQKLAERIYNELGIACYCYEAAAFIPERRNLAVCRQGEYESLPEKIADPRRRPDFSPDTYNDTIAKSGAINVGARNFLIAVNFNLNTTSVYDASQIALDVREQGRPKAGIPGRLKGCKAIGWYIEEYGIAQVSMNITDIIQTPLHKAYEEVCRAAEARGLKVTGTEIIGLVPKCVLVDAGKYFILRQSQKASPPSTGSTGSLTGSGTISDEELMDIAVKAMNLSDLKPYNPKDRVIECLM